MDDEHSFKTLNEKPGTYEGSPGATTFQVGGKGKPDAVECNRDEEDEVSVMSATSGASKSHKYTATKREEFLEMMVKTNISFEDLKGFAPSLHDKWRGIPPDGESSEDSLSSSSSSSSTSESAESAGRRAAPSG